MGNRVVFKSPGFKQDGQDQAKAGPAKPTGKGGLVRGMGKAAGPGPGKRKRGSSQEAVIPAVAQREKGSFTCSV